MSSHYLLRRRGEAESPRKMLTGKAGLSHALPSGPGGFLDQGGAEGGPVWQAALADKSRQNILSNAVLGWRKL